MTVGMAIRALAGFGRNRSRTMHLVILAGQSLNDPGYAPSEQDGYAGAGGKAWMPTAGPGIRYMPFAPTPNSTETPTWDDTTGISALSMAPAGDRQSPAPGIANTLFGGGAGVKDALFLGVSRGSTGVRALWRSGLAATAKAFIQRYIAQTIASGYLIGSISIYLAHGEEDGRLATSEADYLAWIQEYLTSLRYYARVGLHVAGLDPDAYTIPVIYSLPTQTNSGANAPPGDDKPIYRALAQLAGALSDCYEIGAIYDMGVQKDLVHPTVAGYILRGERVGRVLDEVLDGQTPDAPLRMTGVVLSGTTFTVTLNHTALRDASIGTGLDLNTSYARDGFEWWDVAAGAYIQITDLVYSGTTITGTLASAPSGTVDQNQLRYGLQDTPINSFEKTEGEKPGGVVRRDHAGWTSVFNPSFTHRSWLCNDFIIPTGP